MANRRVLAVILVVLGILWILINGPVEGPVLITFTASHGLSLADLLSLVAFALAAWLWFGRSGASSKGDAMRGIRGD